MVVGTWKITCSPLKIGKGPIAPFRTHRIDTTLKESVIVIHGSVHKLLRSLEKLTELKVATQSACNPLSGI